MPESETVLTDASTIEKPQSLNSDYESTGTAGSTSVVSPNPVKPTDGCDVKDAMIEVLQKQLTKATQNP